MHETVSTNLFFINWIEADFCYWLPFSSLSTRMIEAIKAGFNSKSPAKKSQKGNLPLFTVHFVFYARNNVVEV